MLVVYFVFFILILVMFYIALKENNSKDWIKLQLTSMCIVVFVGLCYGLNDYQATENIYIHHFSIDFIMLVVFYILCILSVIVMKIKDLVIDFKNDENWKKTLLFVIIGVFIYFLLAYYFSWIFNIVDFVKSVIVFLGAFFVVFILSMKIYEKYKKEKQERFSKSIYKYLNKINKDIVTNVRCKKCGKLIKNTRFKCDYCRQKQIDNTKVVIFNKEEILLLCKMLKKKNKCLYAINMEKLLENINMHGMKAVVIGTNISKKDIKKIEESSVNMYIDKKFFDKKRTTYTREIKIFESVINEMCISKEEILYCGSFNDGKLYAATQIGINSIHFLCTDLLEIGVMGFVKLNIDNEFDRVKDADMINDILFKDIWKCE